MNRPWGSLCVVQHNHIIKTYITSRKQDSFCPEKTREELGRLRKEKKVYANKIKDVSNV